MVAIAGWALAILWIAACAVAQFRSKRRRTIEWLLPQWHLFSPEPATSDFALSCRRSDAPGSSPAVLASTAGVPRRLSQVVFHPEGRRAKILRDLVQELRDDRDEGVDVRQLGVYRALMREVAEGCESSGPVQFVLDELTFGEHTAFFSSSREDPSAWVSAPRPPLFEPPASCDEFDADQP